MPKTFKQEIPGEFLDLYRKVFGDPVLAGVSYKWDRNYGYEGYQIGTHVPPEQPPVQGLTAGKISEGRKVVREFLIAVAALWGFQTDTGTPTFSYSGACDQEWWHQFFDDVGGHKWAKFVGATWGPLENYGFVIWGTPTPDVGWNVVTETFPDTVWEVEVGGGWVTHLMIGDSYVRRNYCLTLCAGARRVFFKGVSINFSDVVEEDVRLILEKGVAWWDKEALTWNNQPGGWVEVERWAPGDPPDDQVFMVDATASYRLRFAPETVVLEDPEGSGQVAIWGVTLYGHA